MRDDADSLRYDAALAAALEILEVFDTSPGEPKPVLLSKVVYTILQAVEEVERRRPPVATGPPCLN